jgi:hypothetical protein
MSNEQMFKATAISTWTTATSRLEQLLSSFKDEDLLLEVAPGRNRVYYIVGHLVAFHDRLLPMLRLGDRLHPELDATFIDNPDRSSKDQYPATDLRRFLIEVNEKVTEAIKAMHPVAFLERHAAVSEEYFKKDPLRNRLSVIQNRTAHVAFHLGQIRLVAPPK